MKTLEKMEGLKQKGKDLMVELFRETMIFLEEVKIKSKDLLKTNYELGMFHLNKQNLSDAKMRFKMVSMINPNYLDVFYQLARCYQYSSKIEKSIDCLAKCARGEKVEYRLNLLKKLFIDEIPIEVLEEDFDFLASTYDAQSKSEDFHRSNNIISYLKEILARDDRINDTFSILDVGCGNGDCGKILKTSLNISFLEGIDISQEMIKICESQILDQGISRKTYDKLIKMDFTALQQGHDKKFDIIFVCNALEYGRNISKVILSLRSLLNSNGYLAIQVHKSHDNKDISFDHEKGHFCFGEDYLKSICKDNNLKLSEFALTHQADDEMMIVIIQ